ncbi:MAG: tetratricopeptide repeat protein [Spirochaetota bacterium]
MRYMRIISILLLFIFISIAPVNVYSQVPSIEEAQFNLALDLYKQDRFQEAIVEFRRLLFDMKTVSYRDASYFYAANAYLSLGRVSEARDNFRIIADKLQKSRYHSDALYLYGRCEYLLENYSKAIGLFDLYLKLYPSLQYADNCLYWKGESILDLGRREDARVMFSEVIKRYPLGNKADAARFKIRLMELEEQLGKYVGSIPGTVELSGEVAAYSEEEKQMHKREQKYLEEIERLNTQIDILQTELNNLKEIGKGSGVEREAQIEEKVKALNAWENILRVKEEALNQKEKELNSKLESVEKIISELEKKANE